MMNKLMINKTTINKLWITMMIAAGALCGTARAQYTYTTFNFPGARSTQPFAINDEGDVVGYYFANTPVDLPFGFLLQAGVYTAIDYPGAAETKLVGINDYGVIIGQFCSGTCPTLRFTNSFAYDHGTFTEISFPGAISTYVTGINNRGVICGYYSITGEPVGNFLYNDGTYAPLTFRHSDALLVNGINDGGDLVVDSSVSGYELSESGITPIAAPGATATSVAGLNDSGQVAGYYVNPPGTAPAGQAFVFANGIFQPLYSSTVVTFANGVNNLGVVVGSYEVGREFELETAGFLATPTL